MWKLNVSLRDDEDYLKDLEQNLPKWNQEGEELSDKRSFWDWIKYNIRMHAISFSKEKAKQRNENEKTLTVKQSFHARVFVLEYIRHSVSNSPLKSQLSFKISCFSSDYN